MLFNTGKSIEDKQQSETSVKQWVKLLRVQNGNELNER